MMEPVQERQVRANTCIICGREKIEGIVICDQLICDQCEQEIVRTEVEDEKYHFFVDQMKKIWYRQSS